MIDAEGGFRLWRRILQDQELQGAIFSDEFDQRVARFELSPGELEIARQLNAQGAAAYWPCEGYRFRLLASVRSALEVGAPLTTELLEVHGQKLHELAAAFVIASGWRDDGPHVYRTCSDFLTYMRGRRELAGIAGLTDVMALEAATCALLIRLSELSPDTWLCTGRPEVLSERARYQRAPAADAVALEHDITPWLEAPDRAAETTLAAKPLHILVYLESLEILPEYALLSDVAYTVFCALERPMSLAEVTALLGNTPRAADRAHATLTRLINLGAIRSSGWQEAASASRIVYGTHWDEVAAVRGAAPSDTEAALVGSLVESCSVPDEAHVLDVACGQGLSTIALAESGARATGIDISSRSIAAAEAGRGALAPSTAERLRFRLMDATRLELDDASFDWVTCLKTLWCLPDIDAALREFHRVLRPGGRVAIQLWGELEQCSLLAVGMAALRRFSRTQVPTGFLDPFELSPRKLASMLQRAGFAAATMKVFPYSRAFSVTSPEQFWNLFRSVADTSYYDYISQDDDTRAAITEKWLMEVSRLRDDAGSAPLTLTWSLCIAEKQP